MSPIFCLRQPFTIVPFFLDPELYELLALVDDIRDGRARERKIADKEIRSMILKHSKEGYPAQVDASIEEVDPKDFDGVVISGGFAPDILRRYEKIVQFVRTLHDDGKVVAAICHGGWLLVSADIVKGRKATCFFAIKDDLIAAGANYVDEEVAVDKNIITSRKPEDLPAFVVELIKQLKN